MITCHGDQSYKNDVNNNCHQRKYTPFGGNFKYTILFDAYEKISLLSEKQLFKKVGKGIVMCEDAKKEMEQLIREVRNMLEEDADIKRLFAKNKNTGLQVEIAGVGKVSLEEQTKQAFNLRNQFRTQARELMADRATAESLYKTDPNLTWEEIVRKQSAKGLEGDDI